MNLNLMKIFFLTLFSVLFTPLFVFSQEGGRKMDPPRGGKKMEPEMDRKKMAFRTTAEAHKKLSEIYKDQEKYDLAVGELQKLLTLFEGNPEIFTGPEEKSNSEIQSHFAHLYLEMGEIYIKSKQFDKARKILDEAVKKYEKTARPELLMRFKFLTAELAQKSGNTNEAETLLKQVIESNKANLK